MKAIAAISRNRIIGDKITNKMPRPHQKDDLAYFKEFTTNKPILFGRKTFEQLPKLKTLFTEKLKHHFYNVLEYVDETEIYITQSWMNLAVKDEYHHAHRHPNSVLSGVFYLKTVDEDCISFDNSYRADQVRPGIKNFNDYNSTLYNLNISDNMLVIFPSSLTHAVPPIKNKQTRISLAFNSFVKGKVGRDDTLSSITI